MGELTPPHDAWLTDMTDKDLAEIGLDKLEEVEISRNSPAGVSRDLNVVKVRARPRSLKLLIV